MDDDALVGVDAIIIAPHSGRIHAALESGVNAIVVRDRNQALIGRVVLPARLLESGCARDLTEDGDRCGIGQEGADCLERVRALVG